jgi:vacuolar-type H+-ATPase subunit F/Vma7
MSNNKFGKGKSLAIVADRRTITIFKLAGLKDVYPVESDEEAEKLIRILVENPRFLIILVTGRILNKIQDFIESIVEHKYPLIVPIPSVEGQKIKTDLITSLIKRKAGIEFKLSS